MTKEEYDSITDTERAFFRLEGRCRDCGCELTQIYIAHSQWCKAAPRIIFNPGHEWGKHSTHHVTKSARMGKSVFANMVNELNKIFGKTYENTNS